MTLFPIALAAVTLTFGKTDADFSYQAAKDFVEQCTPRDAGSIRGKIAANFILDHASAAGGDVRLDRFKVKTPDGDKQFTNVIAEFNGNPRGEWVVLISHYDTKKGIDCPGANDGASTTGLLIGMVNMFSHFRSFATNGNLMMIWTDGEECYRSYGKNDGLWGSRHAAEMLKRDGRPVKAVICLDMLGDRDLNISIPRNTSPALRKIIHYAARKTGNEHKVRDIKESVNDDHVPFFEAGFKAVDVIDFEYGSEPGMNNYWHTSEDTIDKISAESLLIAGSIVTEALNVLLY